MTTDKRLDIPSPDSASFETRMREVLQTYLGRTGDPLDRGLTVRDLAALGIIKTVDGTGDKVIAGGPLLPIRPPGLDGDPGDLSPPPTPTGFKCDTGITNVFVECDPPTYTQGRGHDRSVLYGLKINPGDELPTFASALKLADFPGEVFAYTSDPATTWCLWLTWRTRNGVESATPAGGINGIQVRTGEDVQRLLDALNGQITASELNKELSTRISDSSEGVEYLANQFGVRVQVGADGRLLVGGYGIMGSNDKDRGPSIDFGVLANRFYVGAPGVNGAVSSTRPFIVQTTPTYIDGVYVPAGVYIQDGYIKNATITNAKIANAAIDDAKIANLSASKLRAGSISVGQYIQSSNYTASGLYGWKIDGDGNAFFRQVEVRGGVFATYGSIAGILMDEQGLRTAAYGSGNGFFLGRYGNFSLGSKLTWDGYTLTINGDGNFSGTLQAANGTFKGQLLAASGTFSGSLTADAINAVDSLNIAGEAVTVPRFDRGIPNFRMSFNQSTPTYSVGAMNMKAAGTVLVSCTFAVTVDENLNKDVYGIIVFDNSDVFSQGVTAARFNQSTQTIQFAIKDVAPGYHTVGVRFQNLGNAGTNSGTAILSQWAATVLTAMR